MNNFGAIYRAELKKILSKKTVWAALAVGLAFIILVGITNLNSDGRIIYVKEQEQTLTELSGKKLDDEFFSQFRSEIEEFVENNSETFDRIRTCDPDAVFESAASAIGKKALYDLIYNTMRSRKDAAAVNEESFYAKMRDDIICDAKDIGAGQEETAKWLEVWDGIEKPITYSYALAYLNVLDVLFMIGWVLFLIISISLCGIFADEKTCRTDALILSTRNGRIPVCLAKILAGITTSLAEAAILFGVCFSVTFSLYGTQGWDAPIQNVIPSSPWNVTIGRMMLIYMALAAVVSILFAVTNMAASHFSKSAAATTAIHAAIIFAGLFNVPASFGKIARLWQLRPTMALYYGTFCNTCFYGPFNNVQISLILFAGLSVLFCALLVASYVKSQIESR